MQSSTIVGFQQTINSVKNQLEKLQEFETEFRDNQFFDITAKQLANHSETLENLKNNFTIMKNDRTSFKLINKLEDRIDELQKKTFLLLNDKLKVTLRQVPLIHNKL